jgi:beta-mannosidase
VKLSWELAEAPAGSTLDPKTAAAASLRWRTAVVPGTVAQSLNHDVADPARFDASDWWYRSSFTAPEASAGTVRRLRFEGLATLAEVWLNGERILSARNMFTPYICDVTHLLREGENELYIRFASLDAELAAKKPRPRWRTALVSSQNLRWVRTTLLGRIPGWSPPIQPVGPWKDITLETIDAPTLDRVALKTSLKGTSGQVHLEGRVLLPAGVTISSALLHVGAHTAPIALTARAGGADFSGTLDIPEAPLWWPHTHGDPALLDCRLELKSGARATNLACGRLGFRRLELDRTGGQVRLSVNGSPVFFRGACWTVADIRRLAVGEAELRKLLTLARDGGMNMIRVGGTMTYETDEFYSLCDELGIMVWQDFMFANMDYPVGDANFSSEIENEARHQLGRLSRHASLAVYCGGSEVQQQAAMMGFPATEWSNDFFDQRLPALCRELHPGVPYFPSSPCEGALPFSVSEGLSHYYGVGAYLRPLNDVKSADVKFTPECLGFSNVPEQELVEELGGGALPAPHSPLWKRRVPRDNGAGWDFEDVRDHYLKTLFGVDPVALRYQDLPRYYDASRAVTGEVMTAVFAEWRRGQSACGGALVWFFNDLWAGAGWGIVDAQARPKAAWHYLKRAWASQAVLLTDEGLDGYKLHALNETGKPLRAVVALELYTNQKLRSAVAERAIEIPARGAITLKADELLGHFTDANNAYRFGPAKYDVVRAVLRCAETGKLLGEDFRFPQGLNLKAHEPDVLEIASISAPLTLTLKSRCFLQSVRLVAKGFEPSENHFHLAPGVEKRIEFKPVGEPGRVLRVEINALNLSSPGSAR